MIHGLWNNGQRQEAREERFPLIYQGWSQCFNRDKNILHEQCIYDPRVVIVSSQLDPGDHELYIKHRCDNGTSFFFHFLLFLHRSMTRSVGSLQTMLVIGETGLLTSISFLGIDQKREITVWWDHNHHIEELKSWTSHPKIKTNPQKGKIKNPCNIAGFFIILCGSESS